MFDEIPEERQDLLGNWMFLVKVDKEVDPGKQPPEYLLELLNQFEGQEAMTAAKVSKELDYIRKSIQDDSQLSNLSRDVRSHLLNTYRDVNRRWDILPRRELEQYQRDVTVPWFRGLFEIAVEEAERNHADLFATSHFVPAKEADDLTDVKLDVPKGLINIPEEDTEYLNGINASNGEVKDYDTESLGLDLNYVDSRLDEIESDFDNAIEIAEGLKSNYDERKIDLMRQIGLSWYEEAIEHYDL